jgi:hypothetical protein
MTQLVAAPAHAKEIFVFILAASRGVRAVESWAARQGWNLREVHAAINWLTHRGMVGRHGQLDAEVLQVKGSASWPAELTSEEPAAAPVLRKAAPRHTDEDNADDEDSEADSDDDDEGEDERDEPESDVPDSDEGDDQPPESEEPESARVARKPAGRPRAVTPPPASDEAPAWLGELKVLLGHEQTLARLGNWAANRGLHWSRVKAALAELVESGEVLKRGSKIQPRYRLAGVELKPAQLTTAERAAQGEQAAEPTPAPIEPVEVTPPSPRVVQAPRVPALSAPDLLAQVARLPAPEREAFMARFELVGRLAANVDWLRGELARAEAQLEAGLRGELDEGPTQESEAALEATVAPAQQPTGPAAGKTIVERVFDAIAPGGVVRAEDLTDVLGLTVRQVSPALVVLARKGRLERVESGTYRRPGGARKGAA